MMWGMYIIGFWGVVIISLTILGVTLVGIGFGNHHLPLGIIGVLFLVIALYLLLTHISDIGRRNR